jgi:phage/plasmid-like protein (TIGR03299 family)
MAHNIDSMFSVREKPWHYMETKDVTRIIQEAPNSADALTAAGLDWLVIQKPVHMEDGSVIPNYKANVRSKDNSVLGIVTDRYKIVQNKDAFSFTDNLIGGDVRYETAGALQGGRKVWLLAKLPAKTVAGDEVEPYLCFTNSHDGTGAIKVCMTPIRVVCNNTLNLALDSAKRMWSTKHLGNVEQKIYEARHCLMMADTYMEHLNEYAEQLAKVKVTDEELKSILAEMFPVEEDDTNRKKSSAEQAKESYMICYFAPDIEKFRGTAWGVVNAMADMVGHSTPLRRTKNYAENQWGRIMDGHMLMDKLVDRVGAMVK